MFVAKLSNMNDGHSSSHKVSTFTTAIVYLKVFKFFRKKVPKFTMAIVYRKRYMVAKFPHFE